MTDDDLLHAFVRCFLLFDEPLDESSFTYESAATPLPVLDPLYERLPGKFPPLFEQLLMRYRWPEVEIEGGLRLLPNLGADLSRFLAEVTRDPILTSVLLPQGFVPFAKAPDYCYDPICFDVWNRSPEGDCPIRRFEHEAILCEDRIGEWSIVASSFRELLQRTTNREV